MIYTLISGFLTKILSEIAAFIPTVQGGLIDLALRAEHLSNSSSYFTQSLLTEELISSIYYTVYAAILILVVLKFVWKGFQVYVLWRDGDSEVSPHHFLIGVAAALIISLAFPTLYNIAAGVTADIGKTVIQKINVEVGLDNALFDNEAVDEKSSAIWEEFFATFDANGDGSLSETEAAALNYYLSRDAGARDYIDRLTAALPGLIGFEVTTVEDYNTVRLYLSDLAQDGNLSILTVKSLLRDSAVERFDWLFSPYEATVTELLMLIVYVVCYAILYFRIVARSVEMLFLRWGVPLAAIGLINSDSGIFPSYIFLMLKQMATTLIQVTAMLLSVYIFAGHSGITNVALAIAVLCVAMRAPALLSEIMAPQNRGGGGFQTAVQAGATVVRLVASL